MKIIEVMFKLGEPIPEWQEELLWSSKKLHVQVSEEAPTRVWILFQVEDDYEEGD